MASLKSLSYNESGGIMKYLALILISLPVYSNTFVLKDSSARFTLSISKTELKYVSESLKKTFEIKPCNLDLAKRLNAEIISKLPGRSSADGFTFLVDDKEFKVPVKSELASLVTFMEPKILSFAVEEKEACK
jgi:hypothetical protein